MWPDGLKIKGMGPNCLLQAVAHGVRRPSCPKFVFFCIADHFEPEWNGASKELQRERVRLWRCEYPKLFLDFGDSRGRPPQHTYFYPAEVYDPEHLEELAQLVREGLGDVEVHLHHDNDNENRLREFLSNYVRSLHDRHGLLSQDSQGNIRYAFIHGNWALDDSHPDGRWCGVKNEIDVLIETGCYADLTMPSAPHAAQTSTINQIYYAVDDPKRSKSHDRGKQAEVGRSSPAHSLMMIQGPLLLSFRSGRLKLENGNISGSQPPNIDRLDDWLRANVIVKGNPDWLFVKLHTHGANEANSRVLLGPSMVQFHQDLKARAAGEGWEYYYVTAREMANLIRQAELGLDRPDFSRPDFSRLS